MAKESTVSKKYAPQSTRGRGRPKNSSALVYLQTGFTDDIYGKLRTIAKRKGVNESDIIRIFVANGLESVSV